jgi:CHAT domain-containing protein
MLDFRQRSTRRAGWLLLTMAMLAAAQPAQAATWIEQAQADLTCTGEANASERLGLNAPWLPTPLDAKGVTAYFRGKPQNAQHAKFRHLTLLAGVGWWADLVNDQVLRQDVYLTIGALADRYANANDGILFRQIARCARTHLISTQIELERPQVADEFARQLAALYPAAAPTDSVEDWPVVLALRELRLEPVARAGSDVLATRFARLATGAADTGQSGRASRNRQATFDSLVLQSKAAEAQQRYDEMARLRTAAFRELAQQRGLDRFPMPFYRHALEQLALQRDADLGTLAKRDPAFAARTLASYTGMYDKLLAQTQAQFVADAREQLFFQYKIDNNLHALAELSSAMPRSVDEITETAFRLAQMRSYGRLTLATLAGELSRTNLDPQARSSVERYFSLATQTAVWLRTLLVTLRVPADVSLPDGETLWMAFFTLDVFYNETSREFDRYTAFVRQKAPGIADLATPHPQALREFQRRLRPGEAIVATLVTPLDLYIWAITPDKAVMTRQRVTEREVKAKVQRLRAGLTPGSGGAMPAFDASAAYELYRLVFAPVAQALQGVTEVSWYGHGPLGAVPPAVLISAPPAKPLLRTPAEFNQAKFLVDRYAFSALADLSLFAWHRDRPPVSRGESRFLGVGAPLLTADEVAGGPRSRSYELAGGLDGTELAALPKLAESVDEMRGLAAIVGEPNATLWLGPDASEDRFVADALRGYRLIALATHGFLPGEVQNIPEPALMLALAPGRQDRVDGLLTSREIAALKLDSPLVILSACNTASADGRPRGETFTGLSQAFFNAGARSLMVSHWPVMSGAAVQLTVGVVERSRAPNTSLSKSLQLAMQAARKAGANSAIEAHPSFWGPFVIVGDGR